MKVQLIHIIKEHLNVLVNKSLIFLLQDKKEQYAENQGGTGLIENKNRESSKGL